MNSAAEVTRRRAGADIAVQLVGRVLNFFPGIVVTLLLARHLGRAGYGEWATILAITQIAGYVGDLGFEQVALSRAAAEPARAAQWLGALLSLRLAIAIPLTLACAGLQVVVARNSDMALAGALVSGTLLLGAGTVAQLVFQLRVRNDLTIATTSLNSLLWMGTVIALAAGGSSLSAFAAALLVTSALVSAIQLALGWRMIPLLPRGTRGLWPTLIKIGVPLGIAGACVAAYERLDQLLVFLFAGATHAGYYAAAYRVLDAFHFIPVAVMTTVFPIVTSAFATDSARVRRVSQTALDYLVVLTVPVFAVSLTAGRPIIELLFGSRFSRAADALPVLMAALIANAVGYLAGPFIVLLRLERRFVIYAGLGLAVNAVANCILIPIYGFVAAAWVTLVTELVVSGLATRRVMRSAQLRFRLGRVARALVAGAATAALTYLLRRAGTPIGWILAIAAAGYTGLALVLRAVSANDVRLMLARS